MDSSLQIDAPPLTPTSSETPPRTRRRVSQRQCQTPLAAGSSTEDLSLGAIIGQRIGVYDGTKHREELLECYITGEFPFQVWHATWKGTCASCWRPFRKLSPVTRHAVVSCLVVHAACRHGALPSCVDCGEEAADGMSFRKVRNQKLLRCSRCARLARTAPSS